MDNPIAAQVVAAASAATRALYEYRDADRHANPRRRRAVDRRARQPRHPPTLRALRQDEVRQRIPLWEINHAYAYLSLRILERRR